MEHSIVIGERSQMLTHTLQHFSNYLGLDLSNPPFNLHPKHDSLRYIRQSIRNAIRPRATAQSSTKNGWILVSLPEHEYAQTSSIPGNKAKLNALFGVNGKGQSQTPLIYFASNHMLPLDSLKAWSGPIFGVHYLYGPSVTDLENQTAVITFDPLKKTHHLHASTLSQLEHLLSKKMKHKHVVIITPEQHDQLMSERQFLTHSFFLLAASAIVDAPIEQQIKTPFIQTILNTAHRITSGKSHVYFGIRQNPFVAHYFPEWQKKLAQISTSNLHDYLIQVATITHETSQRYLEQLGLTANQSKQIHTPISRIRDELFLNIPQVESEVCNGSYIPSGERYFKSLVSSSVYNDFYNQLNRCITQLLQANDPR